MTTTSALSDTDFTVRFCRLAATSGAIELNRQAGLYGGLQPIFPARIQGVENGKGSRPETSFEAPRRALEDTSAELG